MKKKLKLDDLRVKSFVTDTPEAEGGVSGASQCLCTVSLCFTDVIFCYTYELCDTYEFCDTSFDIRCVP